ncbi:hypothetical protein [Nocardia sp. SC052]|uniref:hypothetical protein n=1 Tax=Nocardia sichangensis TaxID=3385975 RepID=UPI0039A3BBF8
MSDLIKLTMPTAPYESFWVSASSVVLVEPITQAYGHHAKAQILLEGGEKRQCLESAAEVEQLIAQAHSAVREVQP